MVMLNSQDLRRCKHCGLHTAVDSHKDCTYSHDGFAGAHISLKEPVHLKPRSQIRPNFTQCFNLPLGQRKRKPFIKKSTSQLTRFHDRCLAACDLDPFNFGHALLTEKQLFELYPLSRIRELAFRGLLMKL